MKVIIIGTAHPYRGGLATFNERLANQFQQEGHEVELYTFTLQYPNFLFPGKTQYTAEPAPKNLRIHRKINSCNPFNWIKVGREINSKNADMVVFCYWMSFMAPCFGTIASFINKKATCVGLVHNMLPHEPSLLDKILPPYFVKQMNGFVALSKSVVADIASIDKHSKPKLSSPHPIYDHYGDIVEKAVACKNINLNPDENYLLFFGFIRAYKGLDLLLDAMHLMQEQNLPVKLIVAGEFYEDAQPYLDQIKAHNMQDAIIIRNDFIPDNEISSYFGSADLIVQPYKTATQSGVTQVAFHFNKPMLVSNVGGLGEIVLHQQIGYAVEPNPTEIANAIVDFYKNKRSESFVAALHNEKQKYSWDKLTQAFLSVKEQAKL